MFIHNPSHFRLYEQNWKCVCVYVCVYLYVCLCVVYAHMHAWAREECQVSLPLFTCSLEVGSPTGLQACLAVCKPHDFLSIPLSPRITENMAKPSFLWVPILIKKALLCTEPFLQSHRCFLNPACHAVLMCGVCGYACQGKERHLGQAHPHE